MLRSQAPNHNKGVRSPNEAGEAPTECGRANPVPGSAQSRREEQDGFEMNNVGSRKRVASLRLAWRAGQVSNQRHDHEL